MANSLHAAKVAKNDEFYTQLGDIEKELRYYKNHFNGKVVFCNCDDPYESNFFKYFALNFNALGLKKLICTCYDGSPFMGDELVFDFDVFHQEASKKAYKVEITEVRDENGDGAIDLSDVRFLLQNDKNAISLLKGNGDFRSAESIELLKQADIVVTNPPFSLFREYLDQLMAYQKQFLIIGNMNAITYRETFSYISSNKLWLGYTSPKAFMRPDKTLQSFGNILWYTNLDIQKRHEDIDLYKTYSADEYPKYDNYDAINVDKVADIPCDYDGVMGVPITFLDKYNPEQFEIIGCSGTFALTKELGVLPISDEFIKKYVADGGKRVMTSATPLLACVINGKAVIPYARILIRRRR